MPTAFRLYPKAQTWFGLTGQLLAGGYMLFYTAGTTTPKDVYGEKELTTNNGSRIDLDASGRAENDIWGSGSYFVEWYDSADVKQAEADDVELPGGSALDIPIPEAGEFMTGDGAQLLVDEILQVPDPTGHSGHYLQTDGNTPSWGAGPTAPTVPTLPTEGITTGTNSITIGKKMIQWGTATATASGGAPATKAVTFGTAYTSAPVVQITPTVTSVSASGFLPAVGNTVTLSGFTAKFDNNSGYNQAGEDIVNDITFDWLAVGTIA